MVLVLQWVDGVDFTWKNLFLRWRGIGGKDAAMGIAEIMIEVRKLPNDELLALAAQVDEEAARAVDHRFECLVRDGHFADLAAAALCEEKEGKTVPLYEVLDERELYSFLSMRTSSGPTST